MEKSVNDIYIFFLVLLGARCLPASKPHVIPDLYDCCLVGIGVLILAFFIFYEHTLFLQYFAYISSD